MNAISMKPFGEDLNDPLTLKVKLLISPHLNDFAFKLRIKQSPFSSIAGFPLKTQTQNLTSKGMANKTPTKGTAKSKVTIKLCFIKWLAAYNMPAVKRTLNNVKSTKLE